MAHQKDEPLEQGKFMSLDVEIHPHAEYGYKGEELVRWNHTVIHQNRIARGSWHNFYTDNGPEGTKYVIHTGGEYPFIFADSNYSAKVSKRWLQVARVVI